MLLNVENLSLTYDKKCLFNKASFRILNNEKIGLIGNNGVGKSTLINILCGKVIPDSGKIEFDQKIKVGYLDQYLNVDKKISINDYLKKAFIDLYQKDAEMKKYLELLNNTTDEILIDRYVRLSTNLREVLETADFYSLDSTIARIASGLGITKYGMDTLMGHLSGGQKMKVILAKLLLEKPDLLILDEPTNFLDTIHIDWLVKYLKEYKGNFLIVSHNQSFLNDVVNVIMEIDNAKITRYKGNYQDYLFKKAQADVVYENQYKAQIKEIAALKDYINKNKARDATAKMAKSREKKLEKMEILQKPKNSDIHLKLSFNYQPINSQKFLVVEDLEIGYYYSLLPAMSFFIRSGTKLAITGFNGIGKTTLLKTLIGELKPIKGRFHFVDDAKIAYFEQEHHFENPNLTPLQEIRNYYPLMEDKDIRGVLARCGLVNSLALQPIKTLSGGEQAKLKLCKIMLQKANILILDEPTNHLDKIAKEELMIALKEYKGTVIFVCHEKEFIEQLATQIYNIEDLLTN